MLALYLHIPFCRHKCFYCDFPSHVPQIAEYQAYTVALLQEIELRAADFRTCCFDTVYFGGGTPSLLPPDLFTAIFARLHRSFTILPTAEITLEANPGTVTEQQLSYLRQLGVNRLSFGIQAAQDVLLQKIGRIHTAAQALAALKMAKAAGFTNLSADLMYGLPDQTLEQLQASIAFLVEQQLQHISIYGLQVETKTLFAKLQAAGKLQLPDEALSESMYDYLVEQLPLQGYSRYEISNFARPGYESRHNLAYWQDKEYLGLGAAAHSYLQHNRFYNPADTKAYIDSCQKGILPTITEEKLDLKAWQEEFCFLALRTVQGIDKKRFRANFGQELDVAYGNVLPRLIEQGLLHDTATHLALTSQGMKLGNQVFAEFLLD